MHRISFDVLGLAASSLCALWLCAPTIGRAQTNTLETVVVSGEMPGPGMWRVSKDQNALWIVGTHTPLPQKMKWRSRDVEAIIAQAQEVLAPPRFTVSLKQIGFFTAMTMIPSAMESRKNPDNARLPDLVPADVYARWVTLRDKYIDNTSTDENDIELWRPIFAALELYRSAVAKQGMTGSNQVWSTMEAAAKKHRVKVTPIKFEPTIRDPRAALKEFRKTRLADLDCFTKTIARIETDLEAMRTRANAWSRGDIPKLRGMSFSDQRAACEAAIRDASFMQNLSDRDYRAKLDAEWMATATTALGKNQVTVAALSIENLLAPNGVLEQLRAKGYKIEAPDDLGQ